MRVTDTHVYFWGSYLSNFALAPFAVKDIEFKTSEHYYMYAKALFFRDEEAADQILAAPEAKIAKEIGRRIKNFDAEKWSEPSYFWMKQAVYQKFAQNILIREQLLATGDKVLVEASPLDKIWGVGLPEDDDLILDKANWLGTNWLGQVLMEVRADLRAELAQTA